ncbi:MAG: alpha/beta hydrolase [Clostridia bacterium]|nr:alpha/beta hydrolase [Clostridia bacterium]
MPWWFYLIVGIIVFVAVALRVGAYFILKKLYKPSKRDYDFILDYEIREKGFQKRWLDIPFTAYRRESRYGYEVFGRYYECPAPSDKIMLSIHGHNSCGLSQMKYLELFLSLGYNVFIPDHKRSGFSGGDIITFGATEKYDVIDWIDLLAKEYPGKRFAIFGESMGGATSMMVADLDKRVEYLMEYCGYADFEGLLSKYIKNKTIRKILEPTFESVSRLFFKIEFNDFNAGKSLARVKKPTLIIHSEADKTVDFYNCEKLRAIKPDAKVHIFKDSMHARSMVKYPEEFTKVITEFVREAEEKVNMEQ